MAQRYDVCHRNCGAVDRLTIHRVSGSAIRESAQFAQTLEQHQAALDAAGAPKTFSDTMSGARDDRKGLCELMAYVHEGDTVAVWKLDQLGRNTLHILETVKALTDRGVTLVFTSDGIDSCTPAGRMMIGVLGSLAV